MKLTSFWEDKRQVPSLLKDQEFASPQARFNRVPSHRDLMHATVAKSLPQGEEWAYELKYDGFRVLIRKDGGTVRLLSRKGRDLSESFPELLAEIDQLPDELALDGELVVLDDYEKPDWENARHRWVTVNSAAAQRAADRRPATVFAFDVLFLQGRDQRRKPFLDRKLLLEKILRERTRIRPIVHTRDGAALYAQAVDRELEGVVAKRVAARYVAGRSNNWQKFKTPVGRDRELTRFW
jgi:bifunctional non-homologous end joining protein LigD